MRLPTALLVSGAAGAAAGGISSWINWSPTTLVETSYITVTSQTEVTTTSYCTETVTSTTTTERDIWMTSYETVTATVTTTEDFTQTSYITVTATTEKDFSFTATAYITVTATTEEEFTQTSYNTVTATTEKDFTITDIESFTTTETEQTTQLETITEETTLPVTLTVTSTAQITLCTARIANPTYTPPGPLPANYTWGCPPGTICKPPQVDCNFEVGLPADGYYCSPDECVSAPPLGVLPQWCPSIPADSSSATCPAPKFAPIPPYFNMNPTDFGLDYSIFELTNEMAHTPVVWSSEAPAKVRRQAETAVPSVCYGWCNDCLLEAQSDGKTPALCAKNSAYEIDLADCENCIHAHDSPGEDTFVQIAPQFQQFMAYCASVSPSVQSSIFSTATGTPVPAVQSTTTTVSLKSASGSSATTTPPNPPTSSVSSMFTGAASHRALVPSSSLPLSILFSLLALFWI